MCCEFKSSSIHHQQLCARAAIITSVTYSTQRKRHVTACRVTSIEVFHFRLNRINLATNVREMIQQRRWSLIPFAVSRFDWLFFHSALRHRLEHYPTNQNSRLPNAWLLIYSKRLSWTEMMFFHRGGSSPHSPVSIFIYSTATIRIESVRIFCRFPGEYVFAWKKSALSNWNDSLIAAKGTREV